MRNSYVLRVYPHLALAPFAATNPTPVLTSSALRALFVDAVVHACRPTADGSYECDISFDRGSEGAALTELRDRLIAAGWVVTDAAVSQWVARSTQAGVVGAVLGGSGGALSKNPWMTVFAVGLGYGLGYLAGQYVHEEIARFRASHDPLWGNWQFTSVALPPQRRYRLLQA